MYVMWVVPLIWFELLSLKWLSNVKGLTQKKNMYYLFLKSNFFCVNKKWTNSVLLDTNVFFMII